MRAKRLRFLAFTAPDGLFEVACIDAGAAGHGDTMMVAVQTLMDGVLALIETADDPTRHFLGNPPQEMVTIYEAVHAGRAAPRAALKALGFGSKFIGIGDLLLVPHPHKRKSHSNGAPRIDLGHLETVGV